MITMPPGIQSQLGDAVSVIADSDFWERWDTLVDVSRYCAEACSIALANTFVSLPGSRLEVVE